MGTVIDFPLAGKAIISYIVTLSNTGNIGIKTIIFEPFDLSSLNFVQLTLFYVHTTSEMFEPQITDRLIKWDVENDSISCTETVSVIMLKFFLNHHSCLLYTS